jgi:Ala-tRNA(Pro) deacylase
MTCRQRLEAYLAEHRVSHRMDSHRPAFTAQQAAEAEHVSGHMFAKVVMVRSRGMLHMFVLPAPAHVDLERVADILGDPSARLATESEFVRRFPDCERGAMPAFGNLYGVPVHLDESIARSPRIAMQAGTHEDVLILDYGDFERLVHPLVDSFARVHHGMTA